MGSFTETYITIHSDEELKRDQLLGLMEEKLNESDLARYYKDDAAWSDAGLYLRKRFCFRCGRPITQDDEYLIFKHTTNVSESYLAIHTKDCQD